MGPKPVGGILRSLPTARRSSQYPLVLPGPDCATGYGLAAGRANDFAGNGFRVPHFRKSSETELLRHGCRTLTRLLAASSCRSTIPRQHRPSSRQLRSTERQYPYALRQNLTQPPTIWRSISGHRTPSDISEATRSMRYGEQITTSCRRRARRSRRSRHRRLGTLPTTTIPHTSTGRADLSGSATLATRYYGNLYSSTEMASCAYDFRLVVNKRTTNGYGLVYTGYEYDFTITLTRS